MSRASSISSTSGFVTPETSPEISTSPLPSVIDTDSSKATPIQDLSNGLSSAEPISREAVVKDDADSADTETLGDGLFEELQPRETSATNLFLERLSDSSRSSLHGSDQLEAELAEFGIYDSELLEEDEDLTEFLSENEEWEEHEMQDRGEGELFINGAGGSKRQRHGKKKRWKEAEEELQRGGNRSLAELVAPIILAHPLALLPLIPLLPYSFLPAGVVLFVPVFVAIAGLSACAHVVVVYLSRYLKVTTFEDILYRAAGWHGLIGSRAVQLTGILLIASAWLRATHSILLPVLVSIAPHSRFIQSRTLWTVLFSILIWPSSFSFFRHSHAVARLPEYLLVLVPLVIFLVIGRTAEIVKAGGLVFPLVDDLPVIDSNITANMTPVIERGPQLVKRAAISTSLVNAGTAITLITLFFTPHIRTLPIHSSLIKTSRRWFPGTCLTASGLLVVLCLPFALVPYYLLAKEPSSSMPSIREAGRLAGIFEALQVGSTDVDGNPVTGKGFQTDGWLNLARVCMIILILNTLVLWTSQAKDISLRALGIRREGRAKAQRWLSVVFWVLVTGIACIGGKFADKLEWIGAACVLAVGWLIPAIVFIKTFHVANPLSIVFPAGRNHYQTIPETTTGSPPGEESLPADVTLGEDGQEIMQDPSMDVLLARKERQLQKRRTGRRMWQDLIVFLGILPLGATGVFWCIGVAIGLIPA
ncbi:hypothetical protein NliqN6_5066 [Naganishia liquefaciens]|uniref:Uncharacterized protein n=1 Tax=Naganishia liquefaciens TaxID=104408 RepID=A0A8H3TX23_9TREE|nr:hypothetical protein NliqN6_5066 [Naganishia liquefaciens]